MGIWVLYKPPLLSVFNSIHSSSKYHCIVIISIYNSTMSSNTNSSVQNTASGTPSYASLLILDSSANVVVFPVRPLVNFIPSKVQP